MSAPLVMPRSIARRVSLMGGAALLLVGCEKGAGREIKDLKTKVQERYGANDFAKAYELSVKGLAMARQTLGDKHPDTLYFAQGVSNNAIKMRDTQSAIKALKVELDLRGKAGQSEKKELQKRRTLLIQLAEENGDKPTAIEQTIIIAKSIDMGSGKDPQPTYRPESPYPADLYRQHVEGDVELSFNLDANGTPQNIKVAHATPPNTFDIAAVENFRRWRFTPFIENGQPVASTGHHFLLAFRLSKDRPPA